MKVKLAKRLLQAAVTLLAAKARFWVQAEIPNSAFLSQMELEGVHKLTIKPRHGSFVTWDGTLEVLTHNHVMVPIDVSGDWTELKQFAPRCVKDSGCLVKITDTDLDKRRLELEPVDAQSVRAPTSELVGWAKALTAQQRRVIEQHVAKLTSKLSWASVQQWFKSGTVNNQFEGEFKRVLVHVIAKVAADDADIVARKWLAKAGQLKSAVTNGQLNQAERKLTQAAPDPGYIATTVDTSLFGVVTRLDLKGVLTEATKQAIDQRAIPRAVDYDPLVLALAGSGKVPFEDLLDEFATIWHDSLTNAITQKLVVSL